MITCRGLSKQYGEKAVLDDLTFEVSAGRVTGFLGPNGAGKSTTLRILVGLVQQGRGEALINGRPYADWPTPARVVGVHLDTRSAHPGRKAHAHLLALARYNGIPASRVDVVLNDVGLTGVAQRRVGTFSLGMTQRLGIAASLLGDPEVLLLDEPVNGLDGDGVRWIRHLLQSLAREGRTVLLSSHLMSEMRQTADQVIIIGRGRLIASRATQDLVADASDSVLVESPDEFKLTKLAHTLSQRGAKASRLDDRALEVVGVGVREVGDLAFAQDVPLHQLVAREATLEDAYLKLVAWDVEFKAQRDPTAA